MNDFEHLQSVYRQIHNQQVNEFFRDVDVPDIIEDIRTFPPEVSLKKACLIKDNDTASVIMLRMMLLYFSLRKAQDLQPEIYGIPQTTFQEAHKFSPQVRLHFSENSDDTEDGFPPLRSEITFRLVGETNETINETKARSIANSINAELGTPPFIWQRGWSKATYLDKEKGYDFRLLVPNSNEGSKVVRAVLRIQDDQFKPEIYQFSTREQPATAFPALPDSKLIYGKIRRLPRSRPRGTIVFRRAELLIWGVGGICLVDLTGRKSDLVRA